jgi:peptidoglycan hydrolase-like protein with peptidoglycan-binding domain
LGFLSKGAVTGYYGPQTVKAVKAFQKANNLEQVGSVGTKTLKLLNG